MAFQLAYGEADVLSNALFIAMRQYEERLADPRLSSVHEETRVQLRITRHMYNRIGMSNL